MATVFMKWLETKPKDYDRGIQILTLGRLNRLKGEIVRQYIREGSRVLEIGCGTGTLTQMMAEAGADVIGIDSSQAMLAEAERKIAPATGGGHAKFELMEASQIADRFPETSFDVIVSTLVFSEMPVEQQRFVLEACHKLLTPSGRLLIVDEVVPSGFLPKALYYLVRLPLALITWLVTRTSTRPLRDFKSTLEGAGFSAQIAASALGDSLVLFESTVIQSPIPESRPSIPKLQPKVSVRTLFLDLWTLFFRIIPPYPKFKTGLYAIGEPNRKSPVLVTGNFDLTVRRVVRALHGEVDCWLLVADSAGINIWCAAGGGFFTAEKIIAAIRTSLLKEVVDHHALILPQLCANGVDSWKIRQETGWGVHWGPIEAVDIPEYLACDRKKTNDMRWVAFPLQARLEMVTVTLGFYALMILLPMLIFWRHLFWPVAIALLGLTYFYAVVHPWLPGKDGLWKSIPLAAIALSGLFLYSATWAHLPPQSLFNWALGILALSIFTGGELQGMSPVMRGEQANWIPEGVIFAALGLAYWLGPLVLSWK